MPLVFVTPLRADVMPTPFSAATSLAAPKAAETTIPSTANARQLAMPKMPMQSLYLSLPATTKIAISPLRLVTPSVGGLMFASSAVRPMTTAVTPCRLFPCPSTATPLSRNNVAVQMFLPSAVVDTVTAAAPPSVVARAIKEKKLSPLVVARTVIIV